MRVDFATLAIEPYSETAAELVPPANLAEQSESKQQRFIVRWLRAHEQEPLFIAPCNEADGRNAYKWTPLGRLVGASDLIVLEPRGTFHGLMLELKRAPSQGELRAAQATFLDRARRRNYAAHVAWGYEEALAILRNYLNSPIPCPSNPRSTT